MRTRTAAWTDESVTRLHGLRMPLPGTFVRPCNVVLLQGLGCQPFVPLVKSTEHNEMRWWHVVEEASVLERRAQERDGGEVVLGDASSPATGSSGRNTSALPVPSCPCEAEQDNLAAAILGQRLEPLLAVHSLSCQLCDSPSQFSRRRKRRSGVNSRLLTRGFCHKPLKLTVRPFLFFWICDKMAG